MDAFNAMAPWVGLLGLIGLTGCWEFGAPSYPVDQAVSSGYLDWPDCLDLQAFGFRVPAPWVHLGLWGSGIIKYRATIATLISVG